MYMFSAIAGAYELLQHAVIGISNAPVLLSSHDFLSLEFLNILIRFLLYWNYSLSNNVAQGVSIDDILPESLQSS